MGVPGPGERSTICGEGCAMSCVSMVLNGLGVAIDGAVPNPGVLNAWLVKYVVGTTRTMAAHLRHRNTLYQCLQGDCNNLRLNAPEGLTDRLTLVGEPTHLPALSSVGAQVAAGSAAYLAHVRNRTHFVLVTGVDLTANEILVNDPFYNVVRSARNVDCCSLALSLSHVSAVLV
jgi:hypothetical protein